MKQLEFISREQIDHGRKHHVRAFIASCIFHGLLLCLFLRLTFIYQAHLQPAQNGSPAGGPPISLPTLVIISPPPVIAPPTPPPPVALVEPAPTVPPKLPTPKASVPVLTFQPPAPIPITKPAHTTPPTRPAVAETAPAHPKSVASAPPSTYAPGASEFPHPPYPEEARSHGQTGTVVMSVQFDTRGSVVQARVAQSSGVALLDSQTRAYIREHWHCVAYAGQTVSVPVQYTLENF